MTESDSPTSAQGRWEYSEMYAAFYRDRHVHVEEAEVAQYLNALESEVRALKARLVSAESQLAGFREGVRIGMTYTRRELAEVRDMRAELDALRAKAALAGEANPMTLSRRTLAPGEHVRVHNPEDGSLLYRVHVLEVTSTEVMLGFEEPEAAVKVVSCTNTLTS